MATTHEYEERSSRSQAAHAAGALLHLPEDALRAVLAHLHPVKESEVDGTTRLVVDVALGSLSLVSKAALAALQRLHLAAGRIKAGTVQAAVAQASAPRRAWDLHTLDLSRCQGVRDVSALAGCATLHTLDLLGCRGVTDVSALPLHTLDVRGFGEGEQDEYEDDDDEEAE